MGVEQGEEKGEVDGPYMTVLLLDAFSLSGPADVIASQLVLRVFSWLSPTLTGNIPFFFLGVINSASSSFG